MRKIGVAASLALLAAWNVSASETVDTESGPLIIERLASLDQPWSMAFTPDGRILISEKPGRLRVLENGALSGPLGGVPNVVYGGQGGLLGVAVDPAFATNRFVFLYFVEPDTNQPADPSDPIDPRLGDVSVEGVVLKGGAVMRAELGDTRLSWRKVIWRQTPKTLARGQYGGRLVFAPDGTLFIMGGDRQRFDPAQDNDTTIGKIVRVNPDGTIPQDNPFAGRGGAMREVYSLGHRNALGAAIHPITGRLWASEMGPQGGDELNVIRPGANYGWPLASEGENYDGTPISPHAERPEFEAPVVSWAPSIAPSGMAFYQSDLIPEWQGSMLMGGLASMSLWRLVLDGERVVRQERIEIGERVRDVAVAPDGAILLLTDGPDGALLRLSPVVEAAEAPAPSTMP